MNRQISNYFSKLLVVAFATVAMGLTTDTAAANHYHHINAQAVKIRNKTRVLLKETHHYRLTPNYKYLVADTAELRQLAEHTREIARHEGDLDHLAHDVAKMDRVFHHLENLFDNTELLASQCQGSVIGHTAHVKRLLNAIEDCIHHMQDDIESLRRINVVPAPVVVRRAVVDPGCPYRNSRSYLSQRTVVKTVKTYNIPAKKHYHSSRSYGGYGHGGGGFSFSIGGGSSALHFNF
jgi:uncharacterized membrane protein YgcG